MHESWKTRQWTNRLTISLTNSSPGPTFRVCSTEDDFSKSYGPYAVWSPNHDELKNKNYHLQLIHNRVSRILVPVDFFIIKSGYIQLCYSKMDRYPHPLNHFTNLEFCLIWKDIFSWKRLGPDRSSKILKSLRVSIKSEVIQGCPKRTITVHL